MDMVGLVFEGCSAGEGDGLFATEDFAEDGSHDNDPGKRVIARDFQVGLKL